MSAEILRFPENLGQKDSASLIEPEKIHQIYDSLQEITGQYHDLDSLANEALGEAARCFRADAASIWMVEGNYLRISYCMNNTFGQQQSETMYSGERVPIDENSIAGYVARTGNIVNIEDVRGLGDAPFGWDDTLDKRNLYTTKSMLAVPASNLDDGIVGVLQLINATEDGEIRAFSRTDEALARIYAKYAAEAIGVGQENRGYILDLVEVVKDFDQEETGSHVNRVAAYSVEIYRQWAAATQKPHEEIRRNSDMFRLAGMLHDVGKIPFGDLIRLDRPLSDVEYAEIQDHTRRGADYFRNRNLSISHKPYSMMAAMVAEHHHERWDGTGYPSRLTATDIILWARIVAIADSYDAMRTRSYQKRKSHEEACQDIQQNSGRQFDPSLVAAFIQISDKIEEIAQRYGLE